MILTDLPCFVSCQPKAAGDEQDSKDVSPAKTGENTASVERQERGEDHEDDDLMEEFEKEMKDISVPSSKIGEIRETMEQEFDNIIDEVNLTFPHTFFFFLMHYHLEILTPLSNQN